MTLARMSGSILINRENFGAGDDVIDRLRHVPHAVARPSIDDPSCAHRGSPAYPARSSDRTGMDIEPESGLKPIRLTESQGP